MDHSLIERTSACGRPVTGTVTDAAGATVHVCAQHYRAMRPHATMGFVFTAGYAARNGVAGCQVATLRYEPAS